MDFGCIGTIAPAQSCLAEEIIMNGVAAATEDPRFPQVRPDELDALFVAEAKSHGIESIKGHRSVGGMRASIYNAMPYEGVEALVAFMKKFEEENL